MSEKLIVIGIVLILAGILLLIIGSIIGLTKSNGKTDIAIGGFIGPVPFGFFTEKGMFWIWLAVLAVFIILWFLLRKIT